MKRPSLSDIPVYRSMTEEFRGYNARVRIGDGEFSEMENFSGHDYPVMSTRRPRALIRETTKMHGMVDKDALYYVSGTSLYANGAEVSGLTLTDDDKQLVSMGAYIIIFPDKKWYNTASGEYGSMESSYTSTDTVTFSLSTADGGGITVTTVSTAEPENPANMEYWIDTSGEKAVLKQYSAATGVWGVVPTTYVKIEAAGIAQGFEENDGIYISGVEEGSAAEELNGANIISGIYHSDGGATDYIVVTGLLTSVEQQDTPLTVKRPIPAMDYVVESNNRLWGCRYGLNNDGAVVNEIYASALGDFKNWNRYTGISTDSYTASLGSDGQFTGAISYGGYPYFFKEGIVHKVYGSQPSNFQIQSNPGRGVQRGCSKSLAIVDEILYYKTRDGVVAYDGSNPILISNALGDEVYTDAVGGGLVNTYYIAMTGEDGAQRLFTYDTKQDMWHKEDSAGYTEFCCVDNELYAISSLGLWAMTSGSDTSGIEWKAITGLINPANPYKKYVSRISIKMELEAGGECDIAVNYDDEKTARGYVWRHLANIRGGDTLKTFTASVRPVRCDHLRMMISGRGAAKIFSITKTIEEGSDER